MKMWQDVVLAVLATLALASALTVGPVSLSNNHLYINYTEGASPTNSLLQCGYQLQDDEHVQQVSWVIWDGENKAGTYDWYADETGAGTATGKLQDVIEMGRDDGALQLTQLRYDLSGEYSCSVTLKSGETKEAARWQVLIVDSVSHLSTLQRSTSHCQYKSSYSTLAMFPEPVVRAGLYSESMGDFYEEIPSSRWNKKTHENNSVTYSYSDVTLELNDKTPEDIDFYVVVGVMKADSNYVPISSVEDKRIIMQHLGCEEPRVEEYQHVEYNRDTITCRGEHRDTEAMVICKKGYHADGDVEAVLIRCDETAFKWVLEDGQPARRENLECVIDDSSSAAYASVTLLGAALVFLRLSLL